MRPTMSAAAAKFDTAALFRPMTGHGGGIIMGGGGDGEGYSGACLGPSSLSIKLYSLTFSNPHSLTSITPGGGGGGQGGDGNKGGDNPLVAFWKGYNKLLKDQPLFTKALTSFVGFSAGDFLAQKFIDKAEEVDFKRVLKLAMFGFLIHGPTGHFFYNFLDGKIPGTDALSVASKVRCGPAGD